MFILPHQFFSVENYFGIIPKFIPHPFALNWVRGLLGTNKVKIHGYIIRIVKQIGCIGNCRLFGIYPFLQQIVMILSTLIQRDSLSIANRAG